MASQGDAQARKVSGGEGVDQTWAGFFSIPNVSPCLGPRVSTLPPHQACLLQAELSHITESGKTKLREVLLVAL